MSDYSKTTNFTAKDALSSGDPNKVIKGATHDTEFDNIATASATKANKISSATNNNLVKQDANGDLVDAGYSATTLCKAWVNFNGAGIISGSFNVSSVTRNGTGDYTVTLTTAIGNDDYVVVGNARTDGCFISGGDSAIASGSFPIKCQLHNGTATDSIIYAAVFAT